MPCSVATKESITTNHTSSSRGCMCTYLSVQVGSHGERVIPLRALREGHHSLSLIKTSVDLLLLNLKIGQSSFSRPCTNSCLKDTYHVPDVEFSFMS